jgi:hypothetical protein
MGFIARFLPTHTVDSGYLETTPIIGWGWTIRGFSVWASQQAAEMDLDLPAYGWIIRGSGTVRLADSIPLRLPTSWRDLRNRVGGRAAIESGELGTRAYFCSLPRLAFPLDPEFREGQESLPPDSIAPATRIERIEVWYDNYAGACQE